MHLLPPSRRLNTDFSATVSDRALNILQPALLSIRCSSVKVQPYLRGHVKPSARSSSGGGCHNPAPAQLLEVTMSSGMLALQAAVRQPT